MELAARDTRTVFTAWKTGRLTFGSRPNGSEDWGGQAEALKWTARIKPAEEIRESAKAILGRLKDRKAPEPLTVIAR